MKETNTSGLVKMFDFIAQDMSSNKDYFIKLDSELGDGDLGLTMERGFIAARDFAKNNSTLTPGKLLAMAGMEIIKVAPSTMGTLMGTGFLKGGKAVEGEVFGSSQLIAFYKAFLNGVLERGKAKPGEKTIVDILIPVCEDIEKVSSDDLGEVAKAACSGAERGMESEKGMMSQHGRPAFFREKTLNMTDPGSAALKVMINSISKAFN